VIAQGVAAGQRQDDGVGEYLAGRDGLPLYHDGYDLSVLFCWNYHSIRQFPGQSHKNSQENPYKIHQNRQCIFVENKCI
jgi:hypothetical protein